LTFFTIAILALAHLGRASLTFRGLRLVARTGGFGLRGGGFCGSCGGLIRQAIGLLLRLTVLIRQAHIIDKVIVLTLYKVQKYKAVSIRF
jgi:hypothetical protein